MLDPVAWRVAFPRLGSRRALDSFIDYNLRLIRPDRSEKAQSRVNRASYGSCCEQVNKPRKAIWPVSRYVQANLKPQFAESVRRHHLRKVSRTEASRCEAGFRPGCSPGSNAEREARKRAVSGRVF